MEPSADLNLWFMRFGVGYREIVHAAFIIQELEQGGKGRGFCEETIQSQRRAGTDFIDFSIDLLKFIEEKDKGRLYDYARGMLDGGWTVRQTIQRIPEEVWRIGAPIAAKL